MWKLRVFKVLILYTTVIFVPLSHASNAETGCLCSNTYSNFKYEDGPPDKDTTECFNNFDICYNKLGEFYQITKKNSSGDWSSCSSKCDENQNNENVDSANKPQVNLCRVKPTPCLAEYTHKGVEKQNNECFTSHMCKVKSIPCFEKFDAGDDEEKYKCERADQTDDERTSDLSSDDYVCDFTPNNLDNEDSYGICQPESCLQDGSKFKKIIITVNLYT